MLHETNSTLKTGYAVICRTTYTRVSKIEICVMIFIDHYLVLNYD